MPEHNSLPPEQLYQACDLSQLDFATTAQLTPLEQPLGQQRALRQLLHWHPQLDQLGVDQPRWSEASSVDEALRFAEEVGYPVLVRPSYVLGGRAMEIVHSTQELARYMTVALEAVADAETQTILVDEFLKDAIEVDVDCVSDGKDVVIGGLLAFRDNDVWAEESNEKLRIYEQDTGGEGDLKTDLAEA